MTIETRFNGNQDLEKSSLKSSKETLEMMYYLTSCIYQLMLYQINCKILISISIDDLKMSLTFIALAKSSSKSWNSLEKQRA